MLRLAIFLVALLSLPAMAPAATVPGQDDGTYTAALEAWLADDEESALPAMAGLAQNGNAAAQLLLALIDKTPALQGPWLAQQPRAVRLELMRAPGGFSGQSWAHAAAEATPLARLWLRRWQVDAMPELVLEFAHAGENRAARETLLALAARERRGFTALADDPGFPPELRALVWREWQDAGDNMERIATERAATHPGDPQFRLAGQSPDAAALADWLLQATAAAPLVALCDNACPQSTRECTLALYLLLGGHHALLTSGTPSETLIDNARFNASPRGQAALLRRVLLNADARGRYNQLSRAAELDACLGTLLSEEAQRYRPALPPPAPTEPARD